MNRLILGSLLALCCLTAVRGLTCKVCDIRVWGLCVSGSSETTCAGNCSTISASTSKGSVPLFKKLECSTNCTDGQIRQDSILKFNYDTSCCNKDLCNSASTNRLALSLGPAVAVAWLVKVL